VVPEEQGQEDILHRTDKLKKMIADIQEQYENLIDSAQLYKKGNLNDKEFLFKLGEYMKSLSSMSFLSTQIILELKSVFEENKGQTPQFGSKAAHSGEPLSRLNPQASSSDDTHNIQEPTFKPVTITLENPRHRNDGNPVSIRKCRKCRQGLSIRAKYCNKCGSSQ
jgi:ribosomal protein L40E